MFEIVGFIKLKKNIFLNFKTCKKKLEIDLVWLPSLYDQNSLL
jgi:hypothetical protein